MAESEMYQARGVSSAKNDVHNAIESLDKGLFPGAFCKLLPDELSGSDKHCLLIHADGAGTKSSLAYIYWRETGDIEVFSDLAQDSLAMNLDDMAATGAVDSFLFSNTIARNSFHIPGEVIKQIILGYESLFDSLSDQGIKILSGGGETADLGDLVRTLVLDSTLTARLKRSQVVDLAQTKPGNLIVGLASFGQANHETQYNSGIGSNGLTAARHDLLDKSYAKKYPESFSSQIPEHLVYCGKGMLSDPLKGTDLTLGKALLSPTRIYAPLIRTMLNIAQSAISGIVHCTGGGQTKCLKFGQGLHYFKDNLFDTPPIFKRIMKEGGHSLKQMYPVYNMGQRMEIYCLPEAVADVVDMALEVGIEARVIGHIEESETKANSMTIVHDGQRLSYGG